MKFIVVLLFFLLSCAHKDFEPEEHIIWKKNRMDDLFSEDGYLNIAGLFPIQNGTYTMGSEDSNDIKLPADMPSKLAKITVKDSLIYFEYVERVILNDSIKTESYSYNYYNIKNSFSLGSYIWFVHMDSGSKAIRLKNLNHPLLNTDLEIEFYDYSKEHIVQGRFEKYIEPKILNFNNILGDTYVDTIPGIIYFTINDDDFSLEPTISSSGKFFLAFGDLTNGKETYGGGRYLYVLPEDDQNNVMIDFNKSLNPPCVFSTFTTCPIPRKENNLQVKIESGEKNYNGILFSSVYQ